MHPLGRLDLAVLMLFSNRGSEQPLKCFVLMLAGDLRRDQLCQLECRCAKNLVFNGCVQAAIMVTRVTT